MSDFPWFLFDPVGGLDRNGDRLSPEALRQTVEKMKELCDRMKIILDNSTTTDTKNG